MDKLSKVLITITVIVIIVLSFVSVYQWYLILTKQGLL